MRPRVFLPYLILLAAVWLAYGPALRNGFVWDDTALVLRDPLIRSPWLLGEGLRHFLFIDATASNFYRPLQRAVFTMAYALAGFTPWVFHLTAILVHAGAALALFEFGRHLLRRDEPLCRPRSATGRPWFLEGHSRATVVALAAAVIWAVHPVHSSAVIYVAGLADPLAAILAFGGLALLFAKRPVAAGLCLGAAVFAKESGIFALPVGLAFAWTLAGETDGGLQTEAQTETAFRPLGPSRFFRFAQSALPALLLVFLYVGLRSVAEHTPPPAPTPVPAVVRPILALRAVAEYAQLLVAPVTLKMERDVATPVGVPIQPILFAVRFREWQTLAGALILAGLAVWFSRSGRQTRTRQCLGAAAVTYLPVSNLFALNATVAEHWLYVPSAFLLLAAAASLSGIRQPEDDLAEKGASTKPTGRLGHCCALVRSSVSAHAAPVIFAAMVLALGVRTAVRCGDWRTQESFLLATIRCGGDSDRMFTNLASLKLSRGDIPGAIADFREALQRKPNQPLAMLGLAGALIRQHAWAEAREWLVRCERIPLVRAEALVDRAVLDYQEAGWDRVDLLRKAAAVNPHFWPWRKRYIAHLLERGETRDALRELRSVIDAQAFRAESWAMLGSLLQDAGQSELARSAFSQAAWRDVHWTAPETGVSPVGARASFPAN